MFFGSEGRAAVREGRKPETLHCFLEKYMHLQNQCLDEFFDVSESCVYKCSVYESDYDRGIYEGVCESDCDRGVYEGVCESDSNCGIYESVHDPAEEYGNGRKWSEQEGNYKTAEEIRKYLKSADSSDMTAYGYFQDDRYGCKGQIYWECMHDYVSLEYYRGSFKGRKRILKAVGNFLKGELDLGHVLNAYHIILNEENVGMHLIVTSSVRVQ